jgi:uncharacterized protein (DUF302 family)
MTTPSEKLGMTVVLNTDFESAEAKVTEVLKAEGFGILTEIDVKATLKKKMDVDFRPYKILGACNPKLAYRALSGDSTVGLLMPCNVTVSQVGENQIEVSIVDPVHMMQFIDNEEVTCVADEAREMLVRAFNNLQA